MAQQGKYTGKYYGKYQGRRSQSVANLSATLAGQAQLAAELSSATVAVPEPVFTTTYDTPFVFGRPRYRIPASVAVQQAGGIASAEAFGRATLGSAIGAGSVRSATVVQLPRVRRGWIVQDEDFLLLAA